MNTYINKTSLKILYGSVSAACTLVLISNNVIQASLSSGPSMLPTLNISNDYVIINKLSKFKRGDVVTCISPINPFRTIVKRLIAVAGDEIFIDPTNNLSEKIIIPKGHVWLQGDNYESSRDSRFFGFLPVLQNEKNKCSLEAVSLILNRKASMCIDDTDNELIALEIIYLYVQLLDQYFGNVCELDIIYGMQNAYVILDELFIGGEVQESSKNRIIKGIKKIQEAENFELLELITSGEI
ncbi:hypothetical protein HDU92_005215 [Lobulomyces angularis]|nr:hypothetical protein HDU92_005215 [Lobulomyces angularis]